MNIKEVLEVKIKIKDVYTENRREDLQAKLDKTVNKLENSQNTGRISELNVAYWLNKALNDGIEYAINEYCLNDDFIK